MLIEIIICASIIVGLGIRKFYKKHTPSIFEIRFYNNFYHDELILTLPYMNVTENLETNLYLLTKNPIFMSFMEPLHVKFIEVYDCENQHALLEYSCAHHDILLR